MKTVLAIDNDESILLLYDMILSRSNKATLQARTGAEGLQIARTRQPDVIILDDRLPFMRSADVCGQLRQNPNTQHIPIVVTSTALIRNTTEYIQHVGADAFLPKPFLADQVDALLGEIL